MPSTRGTYSGGYCYDYLSITAMTLEFTFQYLESDGSMAASSVAAGSAAKINITAYFDYMIQVICPQSEEMGIILAILGGTVQWLNNIHASVLKRKTNL